jgi:DNA-binding response OmpR family regulator
MNIHSRFNFLLTFTLTFSTPHPFPMPAATTPHQSRSVLIVEDDNSIREALREAITTDGHNAICAADGGQAVRLFGEDKFDLVLLDIMLPVLSGYDVCRKIRETNRTVPIIMLTAKGEEIDKVLGLELGADDYVTKPFGLREILARVHAAFRRQANTPTAPAPSASTAAPVAAGGDSTFTMGDAIIDRKRFTVTRGSKREEVTARELQLLEFFHRRQGEVLSRDQLLNECWGINYQGTTRTLDQHVAQLRKKIGDTHARLIKTVHGVGYQYIG